MMDGKLQLQQQLYQQFEGVVTEQDGQEYYQRSEYVATQPLQEPVLQDGLGAGDLRGQVESYQESQREEEQAAVHQDQHEQAVGLDVETAEEARSESDLTNAEPGLQAQEANGSFGQADGGNNELLFQGTGG